MTATIEEQFQHKHNTTSEIARECIEGAKQKLAQRHLVASDENGPQQREEILAAADTIFLHKKTIPEGPKDSKKEEEPTSCFKKCCKQKITWGKIFKEPTSDSSDPQGAECIVM